MNADSYSNIANLRLLLRGLAVLAWLGAFEVGHGQSPQPHPSLSEQFRIMQNTWDEQTRQHRDGDHSIRVTKPEEFIANYVSLAEAHPKDPATCEAVLWLKNRFRKIAGAEKAEALARREWPLAGEYLDLQSEHAEAQEKFLEASRKAASDEQRQKIFEEHYPKPEKFSSCFLALARKEPKSPPGKEALTWIIQNVRQGSDFEASLDLVRQHHALSPGVAVICPSLVHSQADGAERLLREVAEKNPDAEAKGTAQLALARSLAYRAEGIRYLKSGAITAEQLTMAESYYGKERLARLRAADPATVVAEAEKLFATVVGKYASVRTPTGSLADEAKTELFEIRNLGIGKVAPEIEGEDVDGKKFKLSDYRGKVVVIDFWGDW